MMKAARPFTDRFTSSGAGHASPRAGWSLLSQVASSASNSLLIVAVSLVGSTQDVGRVGLAALIYQLSTGLQRSIYGEIIIISKPDLVASLDRGVRRSAAQFGLCVGAVIALVSFFVDSVQQEFRVLAVFIPLLFLQDLLRYISFARLRPQVAAMGDCIWVGVFLIYCLALSRGLDGGASETFAAWCTAGLCSLLAMTLAMRPSNGLADGWLKTKWPEIKFFLPDYLAASAVAAGPSLFVASFASLEELGALRLAVTYLGPVAVLWAAIANTITPSLIRTPRPDLRIERWATTLLVTCLVLWFGLGFGLPTAFGTAVLGQTWTEARKWLPWMALAYLGASTYGGGIVALRVSGAARRLASIRLSAAPISVAAPCIGFVLAGRAGFGLATLIVGVATGMAIWPAARAAKKQWGN